MAVTHRQLLVTTALEETWGKEESIVFLGDWCKRYERRHVWSGRSHQAVQFHWDDREKLRRDYEYLYALHHALLTSLAASLNGFHHVDQSVRYWQILLDPWLLSYLAVTFDRWECLRVALEVNGELEYVSLDGCGDEVSPFSYSEFLVAALSDQWNQSLYQRIIEGEYSGVCVRRPGNGQALRLAISMSKAESKPRCSVFGRVVANADRVFGKLFSKYDVVFLGSTFGLTSLFWLNLALGQVPRLFLGEFGVPVQESDLPAPSSGLRERIDLRLDFQANSRFEEFVKQWVIHDLPRCLVEHYPALRDRARDVGVMAKVVVTGSSQWTDVFAKAWFAEQVSNGVKLVIAEHGGSLPPFSEFFGFEEDIADVKATWFSPYHPKHIQLPPAKLVARLTVRLSPVTRASGSQHCSVIGNECARWVHRVHYYPMASQWSTSFGMVLEFHERLDETVRQCFRVKPYPSDQGWNTQARFSDVLGAEKICSEKRLDRVFLESRVIVCTYPETTFAEAMASGVPTILMYPAHLYELNPVALPLLEILKSANIVFHDPTMAAAHLSVIWSDPDKWWKSELVVHARAEFRRQALHLEGDWVGKWKVFLDGLIA